MLKNDFNPSPDDAVKAEKIACEFTAKRITSWGLKDDKGSDVPCTADACARLVGGLFNRVYLIIRGEMLSDPKPPAETPPESLQELQKN